MSWELTEAIDYYRRQGAPGDQNALRNLLGEIQNASGDAIPGYLLPQVAEKLGVKESFLAAIIKRIPSLRLQDHHVLEICAGPNCGKHAKVLELALRLAEQTGGKVEIKRVPCMRMCGKGPNVRFNGELHHKATKALLDSLTAICQS